MPVENELYTLHTHTFQSIQFLPKYCVAEDGEGTQSGFTATGGMNNTKRQGDSSYSDLYRYTHLGKQAQNPLVPITVFAH